MENCELVFIQEVLEDVRDVFIVVEDKWFYEYYGIDVKFVGWVVFWDVLVGGKVEGGSMIIQQLVKNIFLINDKIFLCKIKEVIIVINFECDYSKDKLFEMYLNQFYFGYGVYGI